MNKNVKENVVYSYVPDEQSGDPVPLDAVVVHRCRRHPGGCPGVLPGAT